MKQSVFFLGPPGNREKDQWAAAKFLELEGRKVLCGGTACSVVERTADMKAEVDLNSFADSVPACGTMGSILVTECTLTLNRLIQVFDSDYTENNGVSRIKNIINDTERFVIFRAQTYGQKAAEGKSATISRFVEKLQGTGKSVTVIDC